METSRYDSCEPYRTRDGSQIRELMHPAVHGNYAQSLAEAQVAPGERTLAHRHRQSEELYHVMEGRGRLYRDGAVIDLDPGDTVCISPGMVHWIENTGHGTLRFLCCCAPAYRHEDTELVP